MSKHETDAVSLAFGSIFLAAVVWWLLSRMIDVDLPPVGWFFAGGLIVVGLLGLAIAALPRRG
jgi:hypothetical protein